MVEFFNKKEEILEVQLTEYGKYLLSLGKLSPVYYAFFDDEILYDVQSAGLTSEIQNEADRRIRYDTPNLKVVPTRTGAETRVERFIASLEGALGADNSDPANNTEALHQESFIDTVNFSSYPLGTADMTTDKMAAWSISALSNKIDSVEDYIITNPSSSYANDINDGVITRIPQLNIEIDYQTFFREGLIEEDAISGYFTGTGIPANIYLALKKDYLVLDILEGNTNFEKENFDVEVFFQSQMTGSAGTPATTLEAMAFVKGDGPQIVAPSHLGNTKTNVGDVEYYFNLYLDDEMPAEILNELNLTQRDILSNASRFSFNRDLYVTTDDEEPC